MPATRRKSNPIAANEDFRTIPPLADYINRVGADQVNFKKFLVRIWSDHYYTEKASIKLSSDGSIRCSSKEFAPTKEEAEAIKAYFAASAPQWPKSIGATDTKKLLPLITNGHSILYELRSRKDGLIYMVQERRPKTDGSRNKEYYPWAFFSDGIWRQMEPDGDIPFWKPEKRRVTARIMVHEGAKAAEFCDALVNDPKMKKELAKHPWGDFLQLYEHWGIIGGAQAPHRCDFSEIKAQKPKEVVYACDRDWDGMSVLETFSRLYRGPLKGLKFDNRFPEHYDLADPFPSDLFTPDGRYIGPKFKDCLIPSTWATDPMDEAPGKKGRTGYKIRSEFAKEWIHSVKPEIFVNIDWPNKLYTTTEFNNAMSPFSNVKELAPLLQKSNGSKTATIRYSPAHAAGIWVDTDDRFFNTHVAPDLKPEKGDVSPWLEFMEYLVEDENDRLELMRWCATLIARPEIKMSYGVLMVSETQGIGKSTLGEKILAPLVGRDNASFPSEREIVDSSFNGWMARKRLAVVHEVYAGHSSKAYNSLKSAITDQYITVNQKYLAEYQIENWIHFFACSNSLRALQLSIDDRRWLVPKLTEEKRPAEYWDRLNQWLVVDGGICKILYWAHEFLKKNKPVARSDNSPSSKVKLDMIEESWSQGQTLVAQFLDKLKEELDGAPVIVLDTDLVSLIKDVLYEGKHNDRLEKPGTLRKIAKAKGWYVGEKRAFIREWGTIGVGPRILSNVKSVAEALPGDLAKDGRRPLQVLDYYRKSASL